MEVADRDIVSGLKSGKPSGPRLLWGKYSDYLHRAAYRILLDDQDAFTVVSDTLLQAMNKIDSFEFKESENGFRNWLFTICVRKAMDLQKKKIREQAAIALSLDDDRSLRSFKDVLIFESTEVEQTENAELHEMVREFLNKQSERDSCILLCCSEGLPHKQIAEMLGMRTEYVRVYYSRLIKRLEMYLSSKVTKHG